MNNPCLLCADLKSKAPNQKYTNKNNSKVKLNLEEWICLVFKKQKEGMCQAFYLKYYLNLCSEAQKLENQGLIDSICFVKDLGLKVYILDTFTILDIKIINILIDIIFLNYLVY